MSKTDPQAIRELGDITKTANYKIVSVALHTAATEIERLKEWIVMADNRLECKDCQQCVDVARSYLQEALNPMPKKLRSW